MMPAPDFRTYPSYGRDVIECITPRAEAFFAAYCRDNVPCPLTNENPHLVSQRRFITGFDGGGDYVVQALRAAEAKGLVDEADI